MIRNAQVGLQQEPKIEFVDADDESSSQESESEKESEGSFDFEFHSLILDNPPEGNDDPNKEKTMSSKSKSGKLVHAEFEQTVTTAREPAK